MISNSRFLSSSIAPRARASFLGRIRQRVAALGASLASPDHWMLLSTCDWYPDASGYPTHLAGLPARVDAVRPSA